MQIEDYKMQVVQKSSYWFEGFEDFWRNRSLEEGLYTKFHVGFSDWKDGWNRASQDFEEGRRPY